VSHVTLIRMWRDRDDSARPAVLLANGAELLTPFPPNEVVADEKGILR
jgi:hypothetical protein